MRFSNRSFRALGALEIAAGALALAAAAGAAARAQVTVVDMIPAAQSIETGRDAEPNLAVDPAQPLRMAGSAFTADPGGSTGGVLFLSTDGGAHWTITAPVLTGSVPGSCISAFCDITLRFGGSSGRLYVSDLTADGGGNTSLRVSRFNDIFGAAVADALEGRTGPPLQIPDQPYLQATTVLGGSGAGNDRVYVGINDLEPGVGSQSATVDHTLNPVPPLPAGFSSARIESRATAGQDGASVRAAVHNDGTVYAAFYSWRTATTQDIVVVRDDQWAGGAMPFTALSDLGDGMAGQRVATGVSIASGNLGNQRVGISQVSIAVDPADSGVVYVAWGDGASGASMALHVSRSGDHGQHWNEVRTIPTATNPALAVNSQGKVGFLYQQLGNPGGGNRWRTHLELSSDGFATPPSDLLLADVPDSKGSYLGANTIGDYVHLTAVDHDFYGIFSAFNTPDNANFPQGVTYLRQADTASHTLFADAAHTMVVAGSIDPYFFHATDLAADADFFVRDWTDAGGHDLGQEPSTQPAFYTTSDVWNRTTDVAGALVGDAPVNELPQEAGIGPNFAYVRVGRRGAAPPAAPPVDVRPHFLYADFGLGVPYADMVATPDPTLTFHFADTQLTLPDGQGYSWLLPAGHSTHVCIAAEISAPQDPFAPPSLSGHSPGWPTTDLAVLNDNNKAQRNIVYMGATDGSDAAAYALIHNAASFNRSIDIRMDAEPEAIRRLRGARFSACGLPATPFAPGKVLHFPALQPGAERMLRLEVGLRPGAGGGKPLPLHFTEIRDGAPINGFTVGVRTLSLDAMIRETLVRQRQVFFRLDAAFHVPGAADLAARTRDLLRAPRISVERYQALVKGSLSVFKQAVVPVATSTAAECGPTPRSDLKQLQAAKPNLPAALVSAHARFLESLDAAMTVRQHAAGH